MKETMRLEPLVRNKLAGAFSRFASTDLVQSYLQRSVVTRRDLRERVADRYLPFGSEEQFEVAVPYSAGPVPDEIRRMVGNHKIARPFVCEIADVELVGPDAIAVTPEGEYVLEQSVGSPKLLLRSLLEAVSAGVAPRPTSGRHNRSLDVAVSLVGPWSRGYYHWFSDYLLRLEGVDHYVEQTGTEPTLIVPADPPEWMRTSLELAGFGDFDWLEWPGKRTHVRSLVVPSLRRETEYTKPEKGYVFSPRAYRWLGERIRSRVERATEPTRIVISREQADERHVVNQAELMDTLGARGFNLTVLEELTFRDQVRLFSAAERIVAPSGAGLVNMIWADGVDVVTMHGAVVNACYPVLADSLGFGVGVVRCEPEGLDMRADPRDVVDALDNL